jgi:Ca2+-binding RTX toxin-like protein
MSQGLYLRRALSVGLIITMLLASVIMPRSLQAIENVKEITFKFGFSHARFASSVEWSKSTWNYRHPCDKADPSWWKWDLVVTFQLDDTWAKQFRTDPGKVHLSSYSPALIAFLNNKAVGIVPTADNRLILCLSSFLIPYDLLNSLLPVVGDFVTQSQLWVWYESSVSGKVTDAGKPVAGAAVQFYGETYQRTVTTDSAGIYRFEGVSDQQGTLIASLGTRLGSQAFSLPTDGILPDITLLGSWSKTGGRLTSPPIPTDPLPVTPSFKVIKAWPNGDLIAPGSVIYPEVIIQTTGFAFDCAQDFLEHVGDERYGTWPIQGCVPLGDSRYRITFGMPMYAPTEPGGYHSLWQMWHWPSHVGPVIDLSFQVHKPVSLTTVENGELVLLMGDRSTEQSPASASEDEAVVVQQLNAEGTSFKVSAFGAEEQIELPITPIIRAEAGAGNDTIQLMGNDDFPFTAQAILDGGSGNDTLITGNGNDLLTGGSGRDLILAGGGDDVVQSADPNAGATNTSLRMVAAINSADEGDIIIGGLGSDRLIGSPYDDTIGGQTATSCDDQQDISSDYDILIGEGGHDLLVGTEGINLLEGGAGADALCGQGGNDILRGGSENDSLSGGRGNDNLFGNEGADVLSGAEGLDILVGGLGEDLIEGGTEDDALFGDLGVIGRTEQGTFDHNELMIDDATGDADVLRGGDGEDLLFGSGGNDQLWGESGEDYMLGHVGDDQLNGGAGDDILEGRDGSDRLAGEQGQDILVGGSPVAGALDGNDMLFGGDNHDYIAGDNAIIFSTGTTSSADGSQMRVVQLLDISTTDQAIGGADMIMGGTGNDHLWGQMGDDTISGQEGDDVIEGNGDDDAIDGGSENDDIVGGSSAGDGVIGSGVPPTNLSDGADIISSGAGDDVTLGDNGLIVRSLDATGHWLHLPAPYESVIVRAVTMTKTPAQLGAFGNDTITGDGGHDQLYGEQGDDLADGGDGDDALVGDLGVVTLRVEDGSRTTTIAPNQPFVDEVIYRQGTLTRYTQLYSFRTEDGAAGNDVLLGGDGSDTAHAGAGDDIVNGDAGTDIATTSDEDVVFAGYGNDIAWGGRGHDHLWGGYGDDYLDVKPRQATSTSPADPASWFKYGSEDNYQDIDYIYGGWSQDAMQANIGGPGPVPGDRLFDWAGNYNVYYVCSPAYGERVITRSHSPSIIRFLQDMAEADGALTPMTEGSSGFHEIAIVFPKESGKNANPPHTDAPGHFTCN